MALVDVKALIVDVLQEPLDDLTVGTIIKGKAAVSADGKVIHLVGAGRNPQVLGFAAEPLCDGLYQPLAFRTLGINCDRHLSDLLDFW